MYLSSSNSNINEISKTKMRIYLLLFPVILSTLSCCFSFSSSFEYGHDNIPVSVSDLIGNEETKEDFEKYRVGMSRLFDFVRDPCIGWMGRDLDLCNEMFHDIEKNRERESTINEKNDERTSNGIFSYFRRERCWSRFEGVLQSKCYAIMDLEEFMDLGSEMAMCLLEEGDKRKRNIVLARASLLTAMLPSLCQTRILIDTHRLVSHDLTESRERSNILISEIKSDKEELGRMYNENAFLREDAELHRRDHADMVSLDKELHSCMGSREGTEYSLNVSRENEVRLSVQLGDLYRRFEEQSKEYIKCKADADTLRNIQDNTYIALFGKYVLREILQSPTTAAVSIVCTAFLLIVCIKIVNYTIYYGGQGPRLHYLDRREGTEREMEKKEIEMERIRQTRYTDCDDKNSVKLCVKCNAIPVSNLRRKYCDRCRSREPGSKNP